MTFHQRPRLVQDFLVPHLNNETFSHKLHWIDARRGIFRIFWRHQSSSRYMPEDSSVFIEWARLKGLWDPQVNGALTSAKQRMRAALLKLRAVKCLRKESEHRIYQILSREEDFENDEEREMNWFIEQLLNLTSIEDTVFRQV